MIDGRVSIDGFQTKQLSETVRDAYRSFAHGVTSVAMRLNGRDNLNAIQAFLAANGRRGRIIEETRGRAKFIMGGDYGNTERYRIHGGCLGIL